MKRTLIFLLGVAILAPSCEPETKEEIKPQEEKVSVVTTLPSLEFMLNDLSEFRPVQDDWVISGSTISNFDKNGDMSVENGVGILANVNESGSPSSITTILEHGDFELDLEVLVPMGSAYKLLLQSRYPLWVADSADSPEPSVQSMGGIQDSSPLINAARAPGLWQRIQLFFRAPKFDGDGNKIANAKFESVSLNGFLIHKDVELNGPDESSAFSDEVGIAPLMIIGDKGPIAFRNIKYKAFLKEQVVVKDIRYKVYGGKFDYIPDFGTLELEKEGSAENFEGLGDLSGRNDAFNIVFDATIDIPIDGQYLFETSIDDGGNLYIDNELVVHNQGEPGGGRERGLIELTKGSHQLKQTYYQEVWGANLSIEVEGPGIEKSQIPPKVEPEEKEPKKPRKEINVEVKKVPEIIRGFVNHQGDKKTHILSIGIPEGMNYSYDSRNNQLINVWKGEFANVTEMWMNRGASQRLAPLGAILELDPIDYGIESKPTGYMLKENGLPTFQFKLGDQNAKEEIGISEVGNYLRRKLSVDNGELKVTIARGESIIELENGWYSINCEYYLRPVDNGGTWRNNKGVLTAQRTDAGSISYDIYW